MDSFLIELVHSIKNSLASIYHATVLTMDRYDDLEIRKRSHSQVKEDIKKIDSILNSVLNFININTPIIKRNTLKLILDEILEANEKQIQNKRIRIIKKCEQGLPETFIHHEQVRYILNSVLQYAILSTPINGTVGFLIKSFNFQNGTANKETSAENNGGYIEALVGFTRENKPAEQLETATDIPGVQREETINLILKLVEEILQKNHGMMTFEVDKTKLRTFITLRFPIERRKVVYYEPITI
jgi:light-regulated signal transduction histidine kinase (bacteriophytochrome)